MKIKYIAIVLVLICCCNIVSSQSDFESLRVKIAQQYIAPSVNDNQINRLINTIKSDGTWPGIDYVDTTRIAFQHAIHLSNMIELARAYEKPGSSFYKNSRLKQAIDASLNYWLKHDFICENWWNNQIGTPSAMINLLYLLDKDLSSQQLQGMLKIAGRANLDAPGARPSGDRAKIAGLYAETELFKRNEPVFRSILKVLEGEMKFYKKEDNARNALGEQHKNYYVGGRGMQQDYSFHHRADRVNNTTSYGMGFLGAFVEWAYLLHQTEYRFSDKSVHLAIDYYLDGVCKQMVYGRSTDPGVLNRDISRKGTGSIAGIGVPKELSELSNYRNAELLNIIHARKGEPFTVQPFAKFFWQTEHFVFQRPNFYTSVRMYSTRNRNMEEPYNGEGLTNHYRADGANYISVDGNEYFDFAPVCNFRKIPGTTVVQADTMPNENQIQKDGLTDFVGGVTDGLFGAAVFDFKSPHNPLSAKKSWFFFDDKYVCLGAAINSTDAFPVATTLNQCFLKGNVTVNNGKKTQIMKKGERALDHVKWVFHNKIGYIFPEDQKVGLSNETKSGSWFSINRQTTTSKEEVKADAFALWIDHGIKPVDGHYSYIVMPSTDIQKIEGYTANPSVTIISNTADMQAVKNDSIAYFVLYKAGTMTLSDNNTIIKSNAPCMLMIRYNKEVIKSITVSDPTRKLKTLELVINKKIHTPDNNVTTVWDDDTALMTLVIRLPKDDFAGSSEMIEVKDGPVTDDQTFFNNILNLDFPGLEKVKEAVEAKDYLAARTAYVKYLKTRTTPIWFFDWHDFNSPNSRIANYDRTAADKVVSNLLVSCGIPYQFGKTINWSINPSPLQYEEWTWQLSRHPFWYTLGEAYWATGDEKYAQAFVRQLRSWIIDNPLPDNAARGPFSRWRTIETGIRTFGAWPNAFYRFLGSPAFDDESILMMVKSFYEHGIHLLAFPWHNNWLTMELDGLYHIAVLFPELKVSKDWEQYAIKRLHEEKKIQVYPDGAQVELTTGYHGVSLENFLQVYPFAKLNHKTLPDGYISGLESMYTYYLNICMPDGRYPALNDASWGSARQKLKEGYSYFPERKDYLYVATSGKEGVKPSFTSAWMPWAGWYIMRSGWDSLALHSHFEVGPYGPAHHHEDKLSIVLAGYGKRLLTEGATYAYDASQWRKYVLSARAHNVVRVDGKDQNRNARLDEDGISYNWKPLPNRWVSNKSFDFGEGWYTEGFGADLDTTVTHYRALLFVKNAYWLMFDVFTPKDAKEHSYESFFHFNSTKAIINNDFVAAVSNDTNSANLAIVPIKSKEMNVNIVMGQEKPEVQGWVHDERTKDDYACSPVATPVFKRTASGQWIEPYLLYPLKQNEKFPVASIKAINATSFEVAFNNGEKLIVDFTMGRNCIQTLNYTIVGKNKKSVKNEVIK
jgi:chondroitin AC lyase